ncbi:hypothetical protein [Amnibacterium endophyticum]|uniref:Uncharacterized protein n=1 Tax=Amnibacterium endophyticum TaxID=2109337 RepID=A0ABW4LI25_9MICO
MLIDDDLPVAVPVADDNWHARALSTAARDRIDIVGVERIDGLTIETHRKVGWRYASNGHAVAQDLNLEDTARQAVTHITSIELATLDDHPAAALHEAAARRASAVHQRELWPTRPIAVDGEPFVLFTTSTDEGQAAVADLGPVRLAIYGPAIPTDLALHLIPLHSMPLEPLLHANDEDDE